MATAQELLLVNTEDIIRIEASNIPATIASIERSWKKIYPNDVFEYKFLDESIDNFYKAETRLYTLFKLFAVLAMCISCLGLWGLATLAAQHRTKEIGIRRVLGANISSITILIAKNFLELIGIAILIAIPLAWWAGNRWLQDFAYRIPVEAYVFVIVALLTGLLALCTVSYHSIKTAIANPAKSLRSE